MALCVHQIRNCSNKKFIQWYHVHYKCNATDLGKKMFGGLNSLNYILFSWCHLVPHGRKDPVCVGGSTRVKNNDTVSILWHEAENANEREGKKEGREGGTKAVSSASKGI